MKTMADLQQCRTADRHVARKADLCVRVCTRVVVVVVVVQEGEKVVVVV
jgi:hypothetical protein